MDKHKALRDAVSRAMRKECEVWVEKGGHLPFPAMATAALNAVYDALKEPSEQMKEAGAFWYEYIKADVDFPYQVGTWQAMLSASALSSSPLGKGE